MFGLFDKHINDIMDHGEFEININDKLQSIFTVKYAISCLEANH